MSMITTDLIKQLRDATGASVMAVKRALEDVGGDLEKAQIALEKEFGIIAVKKGSRKAGSCIVEAYIHSNRKIGVLLDMCSETDFVANTDEFRQLARDVSMHIAASNPTDLQELLQQEFIKSPGTTVADYVQQYIGKLGENIVIQRFTRYQI